MGKVLSNNDKDKRTAQIEKLCRKAYHPVKDKEPYCQWYSASGCKTSSNDSCKGCKFFSPGIKGKLEILADYAGKLLEDNNNLKALLKDERGRTADLERRLNIR